MFARLILLLLLAALALPAMAASPCHDAPAPKAAMSHHSAPAPAAPEHKDQAVVAHACIGCIPPSSLKTGAQLAPTPPSTEIRVAAVARFAPSKAPAPATPPPRAGA